MGALYRGRQPVGLRARRNHMRIVALVVTGAVVCGTVGACTPPAGNDRALRACETALAHGVVSADPTTIGQIRSLSGGPTTAAGPAWQPGKEAFPGEAADSFGAWCWTGENGHWTSWGVDEHGNKVDFGDFSNPGQTAPPRGPLAVT